MFCENECYHFFKFFYFPDLSINFVDWLHQLCIENLVPGSNFQRRKMCLDVLSTLYEMFTPVEPAIKKRSSLGMSLFTLLK